MNIKTSAAKGCILPMSKKKPLLSGPEYLSKELAAKKSGRSTRRLLELAQQGVIRKQKGIDPDTQRKVTLLNAEDVANLPTTEEMRSGTIVQNIRSSVTAATRQSEARRGPTIWDFEQWRTPTTQLPWLTLSEAAEYTGLPAGYLMIMIKSGELPARNIGNRKGGQWRIARGALDTIAHSEKKPLRVEGSWQS